MKKKTNAKLSAEEKRMEAEIERGEWAPVSSYGGTVAPPRSSSIDVSL